MDERMFQDPEDPYRGRPIQHRVGPVEQEMSNSKAFLLIGVIVFGVVCIYVLAGSLTTLCYLQDKCDFIPGWAIPVAKCLYKVGIIPHL